MQEQEAIITSLDQYFLQCDILKDGCLRVDYLGDTPVEYSLEVLPCDPVIKQYVDGSSVRQYLFAFGSRESYSQDRLQNMENSAFYEQFAAWIERKNRAGIYPELPKGMEARKLSVESTGYLFDGSLSNARYQIQLRLEYFKEAMQDE